MKERRTDNATKWKGIISKNYLFLMLGNEKETMMLSAGTPMPKLYSCVIQAK